MSKEKLEKNLEITGIVINKNHIVTRHSMKGCQNNWHAYGILNNCYRQKGDSVLVRRKYGN